ncbi:MAG: hypothetical protein Q4G22_01300 [Paracoccus sp. (in: a-proteobacteria)]|uniref:hypothetical protein n=1 Tax=Paracoccus sp. TaxID=267 RepID=UPI0026DF3329|nr:hypothetical protein [Paracoccus sp. (in: a-proteobacteria)]MDO5630453.1 hypothetical protein [Paracoccus sp. (in: a-proteobacteria)]
MKPLLVIPAALGDGLKGGMQLRGLFAVRVGPVWVSRFITEMPETLEPILAIAQLSMTHRNTKTLMRVGGAEGGEKGRTHAAGRKWDD